MLFNRIDEMWHHSRLAAELDPFLSLYSGYLACQYYYLGANEEALKEAERVLEVAHNSDFALLVAGAAYSASGERDVASSSHEHRAHLQKLWRWAFAPTYACAGEKADTLRLAEEIRVSPRPVDH